jgi:hypothetical protein
MIFAMQSDGIAKPGKRQPPIFLVLLALWALWAFGYRTVWQRYNTQVEGVVVSSVDTPATGVPRYATAYVIRGDDGINRFYTAGPSDASLRRSIPVGTRIDKKYGELGYWIGGRWIAFPVMFYSPILFLALGVLLSAAVTWLRNGGLAAG